MIPTVWAGRLHNFLPLLLLVAAQSLPAQTAANGEATFSTNVDRVVLQATVVNKHGGFVSGLSQDDFHVFEDGKPQAIRFFGHEDIPVAVGLVIDNSGSMGPKRKDVTTAALAFARSSNPMDQMFIVKFNEKISLALPAAMPFTSSPAELEQALTNGQAYGKTALYSAIDAGLQHVEKSTLDKKVLIVVSDGGDNASHHTLDQVLDQAARSDVIIYTIGLFDEYDEARNPGVLKKIARVTGGEFFEPAETKAVVPICKRIAEDIRNQYTISYAPSGQESATGYHSIKVTAAGQHGQKYMVRTRSGYVAAPRANDLGTFSAARQQ